MMDSGAVSQENTAVSTDGSAQASAHSISAAAVTHGIIPLKDGDTFAAFDPDGSISGGTGGLYHRDTRHLSRWRLVLCGQPPLLLGCAPDQDGVLLNADMMPAPVPGVREATGLHVRSSRFLKDGTMHERISVRNHSLVPQAVRLRVETACDFADLFEVRGTPRARRGEAIPAVVGEASVAYACRGLDGRVRRTEISWTPLPAMLAEDAAEFEGELAPGMRMVVWAKVACADEPGGMEKRGFPMALLAARRARRRLLCGAAKLQTSSSGLDEAMGRARADLYMLVTEKPEGLYPYAGVPWFSTAFGRDALLTALMALPLDHRLAAGTLGYLARNQAGEDNPAADAEPGKIIHEVRHGDMAETGEVPFRRYYGSADSTPLFVALAGAYLRRTGDLELLDRLWPNLERALDWMGGRGDRDGDGFQEYGRMTPDGLANQGWKDSWDAVSHADGSLAEGPIALCEVQGYAYAAWLAGSEIAEALGMKRRAAEWRGRAARLREEFARRFWCEEMGAYALALDGNKRQCKVLSSNAGAVLWTGIAKQDHAASVARAMTSPRMWTGWGVRTLAQGEARYDPTSYHNGSVWPHDNALIAVGMARYGHGSQAAMLFSGMADAAAAIPSRRLPELFCGFRRLAGQPPVPYPVACSPQAWAAAALPAMLVACLGMDARAAEEGALTFERPMLPGFLHRVSLLGLEVGDGLLDVSVESRQGGSAAVRVESRTGSAQVRTVS